MLLAMNKHSGNCSDRLKSIHIYTMHLWMQIHFCLSDVLAHTVFCLALYIKNMSRLFYPNLHQNRFFLMTSSIKCCSQKRKKKLNMRQVAFSTHLALGWWLSKVWALGLSGRLTDWRSAGWASTPTCCNTSQIKHCYLGFFFLSSSGSSRKTLSCNQLYSVYYIVSRSLWAGGNRASRVVKKKRHCNIDTE